MDARLLRAALAAAIAVSFGSYAFAAGRGQTSVRSQHFIVSAPTPELAEEICRAAETFRKDLAIEWLGRELPPWREPCPIQANVHPQLGAGGVTSFMFDNGVPWGWTMSVQGSRERVLDSVLPHEITHTIFATHFGGPLPRWADEGACTTVESPLEKAKQDKFLIQFLTQDRGIPFNKMFAMKQYPADILPLYSQGYSLARYFIQQGGKPKFVEYVGEGMRTNNWTAATRKFYGFNSLSDLQVTWVDWVRQGSPDLSQLASAEQGESTPTRSVSEGNEAAAVTGAMPGTQMASQTRPRPATPPVQGDAWQSVAAQQDRSLARAQQYETPSQPSNFSAEQYAANRDGLEHSSVSRPVSEGWYAKRRDQAQAVLQSSPQQAAEPAGGQTIPAPPTQTPAAHESFAPAAATPSGSFSPGSPLKAVPKGDRRVLLEWSRADQPGSATIPR